MVKRVFPLDHWVSNWDNLMILHVQCLQYCTVYSNWNLFANMQLYLTCTKKNLHMSKHPKSMEPPCSLLSQPFETGGPLSPAHPPRVHQLLPRISSTLRPPQRVPWQRAAAQCAGTAQGLKRIQRRVVMSGWGFMVKYFWGEMYGYN